jgi:deoxyribodipyrimidine photolyase-related protein
MNLPPRPLLYLPMTTTLIFPHQLFQQHPAIQPGRVICLVEEYLFFRQYCFHKQKLILHRASMQWYAGWLREQSHTVQYVEATTPWCDIRLLVPALAADGITDIHIADPADDWLSRRLTKACAAQQLRLHMHDGPGFLNTPSEGNAFFDGRKTYFQTDFYIAQRKQRSLLLDPDGKPRGGKWTFDTDNRQRYPKHQTLPPLSLPPDNACMTEARQYVSTHFNHHYGHTQTTSYFATNFADADRWLDAFLQTRFAQFGIYEDAIVSSANVLHHSVLSPMLNTGLITPQQVVDKTIAFANQHDIPLNSVEGFIRQIIGWREFIRLVYIREGRKQRTTNFWGFKRPIPASFWTGDTGIPPIDSTIKKILQTGYCHHIERLMVLGNFMLLCEFDPDEVYRWFMEMFIDAYDWVMVPNVYGMTQFADGGLMTTKPYISGSNYLMKMSDYHKGDWQGIWDGLFWRFMHQHRSFFTQNPRLGMLVGTFDKMTVEKKATHINTANAFLDRLDKAMTTNV